MRIRSCYFIVPSLIAGMVLLLIFMNPGVNASTTYERRAVIIVSNITFIDTHEMDKMVAFYDHLIETGWSDSDITVLCPDTSSLSEGIANCTNVEDELNDMASTNSTYGEVIIYISDHSVASENKTYLQFTDGNISTETMDSYFDNTSYDQMTIIMCGNQSGLVGEPFSASDRDVMCSMGEGDCFSPDNFNITRGLENPYADFDYDGTVTLVEAFYSEKALLSITTDQVPRLW